MATQRLLVLVVVLGVFLSVQAQNGFERSLIANKAAIAEAVNSEVFLFATEAVLLARDSNSTVNGSITNGTMNNQTTTNQTTTLNATTCTPTSFQFLPLETPCNELTAKACIPMSSCVGNRTAGTATCSMTAFGTPCNSDFDCDSRFSCINGICDVHRGAGEVCNNIYECVSGDCQAGACVAHAVGADCIGGDCAAGSFCEPNSGKCVASLPLGAPCASYGAVVTSAAANFPAFQSDVLKVCDLGNVCDFYVNSSNFFFGGHCVATFAQPTGAVCGAYGAYSCGYGLRCSSSKLFDGVCEEVIECSDESRCGTFSTCACPENSTTGICTPEIPICNGLYESFSSCLVNAGCPYEIGQVAVEGTCGYSCRNQFSAFSCCLLNILPGFALPPFVNCVTSTTAQDSPLTTGGRVTTGRFTTGQLTTGQLTTVQQTTNVVTTGVFTTGRATTGVATTAARTSGVHAITTGSFSSSSSSSGAVDTSTTGSSATVIKATPMFAAFAAILLFVLTSC